ncbi:DUF6869 domain-containing protein [Microbacterium lacus]|uniref:DUF6869 domain-containing protein n=1 Tax=Microbacterium lacus TaxID=415217 RepID=A0ABN2FXT1_9MICO
MEQVDEIHRWSPRQIADAWIAKWADGTGLDETDPIPDLDHDFELMRHPTIVLDAIVEVVNAVDDDPDDKYFAVLAAGPLEDLLKNHGPVIIDRVIHLADARWQFRKLLAGVWWGEGDVDPEVASLIEAHRGPLW